MVDDLTSVASMHSAMLVTGNLGFSQKNSWRLAVGWTVTCHHLGFLFELLIGVRSW